MKKNYEFNPKETAALNQFLSSIHVFRGLSPAFPVSYIEALLAVALKPGQGSGEYAARMDKEKADASRILGVIGERPRRSDEAYHLISQYPDPLDSRKTQYYLTPQGYQVLKKLLATQGA